MVPLTLAAGYPSKNNPHSGITVMCNYVLMHLCSWIHQTVHAQRIAARDDGSRDVGCEVHALDLRNGWWLIGSLTLLLVAAEQRRETS